MILTDQMIIWNSRYDANRITPPILEIPPLVRKRQKITVVISKNGRSSVKIVMSTAKGETRRTKPKTRVRFVRLEPMIPPIAK